MRRGVHRGDRDRRVRQDFDVRGRTRSPTLIEVSKLFSTLTSTVIESGMSSGWQRTETTSMLVRSTPARSRTAGDSPVNRRRHVGLDRLLGIDLEEVDVNEVAGAALAFDAAKDDVARSAFAGDIELDHRAQAGGLDGALEFARIDLDRLRLDAAAVDVRGQQALAAEPGNFLAEDSAAARPGWQHVQP